MYAMTGTNYAFISNDLSNAKVESVCIPINHDSSSEVYYNKFPLTCREEHTDEVISGLAPSQPHSKIKGPAERKIRLQNPINGLRNSISSDAIKTTFNQSSLDCTVINKCDQHNSISPLESGRSLSSSSSFESFVGTTFNPGSPLMGKTRSKSLQRLFNLAKSSTFAATRYKFRLQSQCSSCGGEEGKNNLSEKAKRVWCAFERRLTQHTRSRIRISKSIGNLEIATNKFKEANFTCPCDLGMKHTGCRVCQEESERSYKQCNAQKKETSDCGDHISGIEDKRFSTMDIPENCTKCLLDQQRGMHQYNRTQLENGLITNCSVNRSKSMNLLNFTSCPYCKELDGIMGRIPRTIIPSKLRIAHELREVTLIRPGTDLRFGMRLEATGKLVYLTTIVQGSPASLAGLKVGDELILLNGLSVSQLDAQTIMDLIRSTPKCLRITYRPRTVVTRLCEVRVEKANGRVGIRLKRNNRSLLVDMVLPDSPAHQAGIREGDEVVCINEHLLLGWTAERAAQLLRVIPNGSRVVLLIRDHGVWKQMTRGASEEAHTEGDDKWDAHRNNEFHSSERTQTSFHTCLNHFPWYQPKYFASYENDILQLDCCSK